MKKIIFKTSLFAFLIIFAPSISNANDKIVQKEDKTVYKKKTKIDFSDINIEGELTKPSGSYVGVRKFIKFRNFIKIRNNFRDKIFSSEDNI